MQHPQEILKRDNQRNIEQRTVFVCCSPGDTKNVLCLPKHNLLYGVDDSWSVLAFIFGFSFGKVGLHHRLGEVSVRRNMQRRYQTALYFCSIQGPGRMDFHRYAGVNGASG